MTLDQEPFNPLDRLHLAENIARILAEQPVRGMPPETFRGAGIYALYYDGAFAAYKPTSSRAFVRPIYVGSALPEGGRTGGMGLVKRKPTKKLHERLRQHAHSIEAVENLAVDDFHTRYLLLDDIWISLAENYLISYHLPLWNSKILEGFGIHAPGKGRRGQRRSLWDELHPGRPHAAERPGARRSARQIRGDIRNHWREVAKTKPKGNV